MNGVLQQYHGSQQRCRPVQAQVAKQLRRGLSDAYDLGFSPDGQEDFSTAFMAIGRFGGMPGMCEESSFRRTQCSAFGEFVRKIVDPSRLSEDALTEWTEFDGICTSPSRTESTIPVLRLAERSGSVNISALQRTERVKGENLDDVNKLYTCADCDEGQRRDTKSISFDPNMPGPQKYCKVCDGRVTTVSPNVASRVRSSLTKQVFVVFQYDEVETVLVPIDADLMLASISRQIGQDNELLLDDDQNGIANLMQVNGERVRFALEAFVVHHGSQEAGHWYAFAKYGEHWYELNDSVVTERTFQDVYEEFKSNSRMVAFRRVR